jgi:hypothetical protein
MVKEMDNYKVGIYAMHEIRWPGRNCGSKNCMILCSDHKSDIIATMNLEQDLILVDILWVTY